MQANRASRSLWMGLCALALGAACSDSNVGPGVVEPIHDPLPANHAFSVAIYPVLGWEGPAAAIYYDLLLGTSRTDLSALAESLQTTRYVPDEPLRANQEYFWQVIAYNDTERWEGATWRFITINPDYLNPVTPSSVMHNLEKAWLARDVTRYDSLLADRFRYVPSVDEPDLAELNRESDLDAMRNLFRSASVLNTSGGVPEALWTIHASAHPGYPADQGYRQADVEGMTFGILWESTDGQTRRYRLPSPDEAETYGAVTGAIFYLAPTWQTVGGDTVWKLVEVRDFYRPPSAPLEGGDGEGHGSGGGGAPPLERTSLVSWGRIKKIGAEIVE